MDSRQIESLISQTLSEYDRATPRAQQAAQGLLGPSDIGFCRNKAALMTKGVPPTDTVPTWAAAVGTAIHNYVENILKQTHPDWLIGSVDKLRVTATLPSGAEISGHPDIVIPEHNMVLDLKTVDGFDWIKRQGTSLQHKYQRHLYAMGLIQAGILNDNDTVYVGNVYLDRSGKNPNPLALIEPMDPTLTPEIDSWVQDVIYAVKNNEDASRDVASPVCERICNFFTVCRGNLPDEDATTINDPELVDAVRMYVEAREEEKDAARRKRAAQNMLSGVSGSTGDYQVRWTEIQPSKVDSFEKAGYFRMDIRRTRKAP
jgi:hypothetical protein